MAGVPVENPKNLEIGEVFKGGAADEANLQKGDIIETINGTVIGTDSTKMVTMIAESKDKPMEWTLRRGNETFNVTITPRAVEGQEGGKVGIAPVLPTRSVGFIEMFKFSGVAMVDTTKVIFEGFRHLINQFSMDDIGGPVRTFEVTGQIAARYRAINKMGGDSKPLSGDI